MAPLAPPSVQVPAASRLRGRPGIQAALASPADAGIHDRNRFGCHPHPCIDGSRPPLALPTLPIPTRAQWPRMLPPSPSTDPRIVWRALPPGLAHSNFWCVTGQYRNATHASPANTDEVDPLHPAHGNLFLRPGHCIHIISTLSRVDKPPRPVRPRRRWHKNVPVVPCAQAAFYLTASFAAATLNLHYSNP